MKTFTLPIRLESLANKRWHYMRRAKYAKSVRMAAKLACPDFELPCVVTMTRIAPRALDDDNLASACKNLRDGIADKLGIDDRDSRVMFVPKQRRGKPKEYAVEVQLQEIA